MNKIMDEADIQKDHDETMNRIGKFLMELRDIGLDEQQKKIVYGCLRDIFGDLAYVELDGLDCEKLCKAAKWAVLYDSTNT